jgi:hypothetical protein
MVGNFEKNSYVMEYDQFWASQVKKWQKSRNMLVLEEMKENISFMSLIRIYCGD